MCHHGDTMCQIKNRIPRCISAGKFRGFSKFQPFRYYGLGCGPLTEILTKALRSILSDYVIVSTVKMTNHCIYSRVDHGSMGHGSWVTWVMGHCFATHDRIVFVYVYQ